MKGPKHDPLFIHMFKDLSEAEGWYIESLKDAMKSSPQSDIPTLGEFYNYVALMQIEKRFQQNMHIGSYQFCDETWMSKDIMRCMPHMWTLGNFKDAPTCMKAVSAQIKDKIAKGVPPTPIKKQTIFDIDAKIKEEGGDKDKKESKEKKREKKHKKKSKKKEKKAEHVISEQDQQAAIWKQQEDEKLKANAGKLLSNISYD